MTTPDYKVEVAFNAGWNTPAASRTWTDVTAYALKVEGLGINVGRRDERSVADPNTLNLVLDNRDGRFTPAKTTGAYYPNVKLGRPIRITATYPPVKAQNLLAANAASFEGGTGGWTVSGTPAPSVATDATFYRFGTKGLKITWAGSGSFPQAQVSTAGLTALVQYTASVWVYVPSGAPDVRLVGSATAGPLSSVKDTWHRLTLTFTQGASTTVTIAVRSSGTPNGSVCYIDGAMLVYGTETDDYLDPTSPSSSTRFLGFVDAWNVSWPATADSFSTCAVTATSRTAWMGAARALRSLTQLTILGDSPAYYWPLSEADGATSAVSLTGALRMRKTGGAITFGSEFAAPTDTQTGCKFTYNRGNLATTSTITLGSAFTFECLWQSTQHASGVGGTTQNIFNFDAGFRNIACTIGDNGLGSTNIYVRDSAFSTAFPSAGLTYDTSVHHIAVVVNGATTTIYVDGVSYATDTGGSSWGGGTGSLSIGSVSGGSSGDDGTLSHVALYTSALAGATISAHSTAALTGWLGETPATRLGRYATWAGVPSGETSFETGQVPGLANIDTTDVTPIDLMRKVEITEEGVLYDAADGTLTFHDRSHRYGAAAAATWAAGVGGVVQADFAPSLDPLSLLNDVTVTSGDQTLTDRTYSQASIDSYGIAQANIEAFTTSEDEVKLHSSWLVGSYSEPAIRAPALTVELAGMSAAEQATAFAITVGKKITVTGLPSQYVASSASYFVEGYAESIRPGSHQITFNVTPASVFEVWLLGDATYGVLDSTTRTAY